MFSNTAVTLKLLLSYFNSACELFTTKTCPSATFRQSAPKYFSASCAEMAMLFGSAIAVSGLPKRMGKVNT